MLLNLTGVNVMPFIHSVRLFLLLSLLLRGAPDTTWILCWSFTPKRHRQLRAKDLPKVPTWIRTHDLKETEIIHNNKFKSTFSKARMSA